jgi:hypothetical protein
MHLSKPTEKSNRKHPARPPASGPLKSASALFAVGVHAAAAVGATASASGAGLPVGVVTTAEVSPLRSYFIPATRLVWQSETGVTHAANLVGRKPGQALLKDAQPPVVLAPAKGGRAGGAVLLDFGTELTGNVEIITPLAREKEPPLVRIRFGESVAEAMA